MLFPEHSVDEAFYQHKMLRYFILSPYNMVRKKKKRTTN